METLVQFETAKLAKEKGYNERSIFYQWSDQKVVKCVLGYSVKNEWHTQEKYDEIEKRKRVYTITIPTQDELKNWLRKTHFLYVLVIPTVTCSWTFKVIDVQCDPQKEIEDLRSGVDAYGYNTYEEAMETGLKQVLNQIKK